MTDTPSVAVSDRAVLKYLQHHLDIDIEQLRAQISQCCERGIDAGAPVVRVDSVRFLIRSKIVVTCFQGSGPPKYKSLVDLARSNLSVNEAGK